MIYLIFLIFGVVFSDVGVDPNSTLYNSNHDITDVNGMPKEELSVPNSFEEVIVEFDSSPLSEENNNIGIINSESEINATTLVGSAEVTADSTGGYSAIKHESRLFQEVLLIARSSSDITNSLSSNDTTDSSHNTTSSSLYSEESTDSSDDTTDSSLSSEETTDSSEDTTDSSDDTTDSSDDTTDSSDDTTDSSPPSDNTTDLSEDTSDSSYKTTGSSLSFDETTTDSSVLSSSSTDSSNSCEANIEANKIWNHLADIALELFRDTLIKNGEDVMPIPDITQTFSTRFMFFPIFGVFVADNGWFHNISTIQRTGDILVTHSNKIFTFKSYLGLGVMKMGYDHYEVELNNVGPKPTGNIEGSVGSNSIELTVALQLGSDDCSSRLVDLKVVEFDNLKLRVTGFGIFNDLVSLKANEAIERNKSFIVKSMENVLIKELSRILANLNCSKIIACIASQL